MDNINIKNPLSCYKDKEMLSEIYQYILEAIQNFNRVFINLEYAKDIISVVKLRYIKEFLCIVEFIYRLKGRKFKILKVIKIIN